MPQMDLPTLPNDLFLLVTAHLPPRDLVRARRVSRSWRAAFTRPDYGALCLRRHFPRCREARRLRRRQQQQQRAASDPGPGPGSASAWAEEEGEDGEEEGRGDWAGVFARVARRYYYLERASGRVVEKIEMAVSSGNAKSDGDDLASRAGADADAPLKGRQPRPPGPGPGPGGREPHPFYSFYRVGPWDRFLRLDGRAAPLHYPEPEWCYGAPEGLLVYPAPLDDDDATAATAAANTPGAAAATGGDPARFPYRILDLATSRRTTVPFDASGKVVRRVRLSARVLAVEWAEAEAHHALNPRTSVHRHWVSLFDVVYRRRRRRARDDGNTTTTDDDDDDDEGQESREKGGGWHAVARCEPFKLHFLGLPLTPVDRFLSAHDAAHYAVYVWQPNRSPYGENDPIESVVVWALPPPPPATSSSPDTSSAIAQTQTQTQPPPRVVRRLTYRDLAFLSLRQRQTPQLCGLALGRGTLYFHEEDHRWASGPQSSAAPPRLHRVRVTAVPVATPPRGPAGAGGGGEAGMVVGGDDEDDDDDDDDDEHPPHGPHKMDECGADGDMDLSFCKRTWTTSAAASSSLSSQLRAAPGSAPYWQNDDDDDTPSPASSTRPPTEQRDTGATTTTGGRSPAHPACYRHEDFPYLTVAEALDPRAGVRFAARHCFMLETVSAHVRPFVAVGSSSSSSSSSSPAQPAHVHGRGGVVGGNGTGGGAGAEGTARMGEVQFADGMWAELMGKGCIGGDERWLVGEDGLGRITVVRF